METSNEYRFERVMIIDDTEIDRYVASHILKKFKFAREILEFDMAPKAIEYLELNQKDSAKLPQLIVLDIRMPVMDGFQFLEHLAELPSPIRESCCVVMLSSSLDRTDHERACNNAIVKIFLNKPLSEESLKSMAKLFAEASEIERKR